MKKYKKPQKFLKVRKVMKCNKEIWQEQTNGEDRNKNVKVKKSGFNYLMSLRFALKV